VSDAYSPYFGRTLNPADEIVITTGANEGMLSAFMGFIEPGDEAIVMEPYFDQYISNIEMAGGKVRIALPTECAESERAGIEGGL
jgi:kynurenine aminotransferase